MRMANLQMTPNGSAGGCASDRELCESVMLKLVGRCGERFSNGETGDAGNLVFCLWLRKSSLWIFLQCHWASCECLSQETRSQTDRRDARGRSGQRKYRKAVPQMAQQSEITSHSRCGCSESLLQIMDQLSALRDRIQADNSEEETPVSREEV